MMKTDNTIKSAMRRSKFGSMLTALAVVLGIAGTLAFGEPMQGESPAAGGARCKNDSQRAMQQFIETLPADQCAQMLEIMNQGTEEALVSLPGIAGSKAKAIQAARPFSSVGDLLRVSGIGSATLIRILKADPAATKAPPARMGS